MVDVTAWLVTYSWLVPLGLLIVGLGMITSPRNDYRMIGYSWISWASVVFLVWCAAFSPPHYAWVMGLCGILYAVYGYWRINPKNKTATELEQEYGIK